MTTNDLAEAVDRVRARQDASNGDALLPFVGFGLDLDHLEGFIGANLVLAFETFDEDNVMVVLRDLAVNMLLVGLMVGEVRDDHERLARRAV